jgi:Tfp pilus assembly protein PilP
MNRVSPVIVGIVAALVAGCGGSSVDDIARNIDDAARAARPKIELPAPRPGVVPEAETESAAMRAVCDALEAYSAEPSQALSDYIADYAERQRVLASFNLSEIDPDAADELADAASDIEDSQEAGEVASELAC